MNYFIKNANEKELEEAKSIVSEMLEEKFSNDEHTKIIQQKCEPHQYDIVHRSDHRIVRVCQACELERITHYTNDHLAMLEYYAADFAQPGSKLYDKIYGKKKT